MNNTKSFQDVADTLVHELKHEKTNESILLLKQKMCKTHDLIKQYTEKVKETERLKLDLEVSKKDSKHMTCNYKSIMNKTRELELTIGNGKKKISELENKINEYVITIAADKQNIQQLTCKINEMEELHCAKIMEYDLQKSFFEDKIKELELELKTTKKLGLKKKKGDDILIDKDTLVTETKSRSCVDVGTNVSLCNLGLNAKPEVQDKNVMARVTVQDKNVMACVMVQDKNVMTDEFYNIKDDPYPLFCAKCEIYLNPAPIKKICEIMTKCPELIEPISSPKRRVREQRRSCKPVSQFSLPNTQKYSDTDKGDISEVLPVSCPLTSFNQNSESIANNSKLEKPCVTPQNFEDVEMKDIDCTKPKTITVNSSYDPLDSGFSLTPLPNINSTELEDSPVRNPSYVKEMKKSIQSLERKMKKQLQRIKEEINTNRSCCHNHVTNCSHGVTGMDVNQFVAIFKSMMEFNYKSKEQMHFQNEQNESINRKKHTENMKKVKLKRLNKKGTNESLWKVEHFDKGPPQDMFRAESNVALKISSAQSELELSLPNQSNSVKMSNASVKAVSSSLIDKNPHTTGMIFVGDDSMSSSMSINEIHDGHNYSSNRKKSSSLGSDCRLQTAVEPSLLRSKSEDVINSHVNSKIAGATAKKSSNQNKGRTGHSLMKKLRNLKKNVRTFSQPCSSQLKNNTILSSDNDSQYYVPVKKQRIAHISKMSACDKEFIDYTAENVGSEISSSQQQVNAENQTDIVLAKKNCEKNDKHNDSAAKCIKTQSTDKIFINEENSETTKGEDSFCDIDNVALFASTPSNIKLNRCNSVPVKHNAIDGNETMQKIKTSSECNKSDLSRGNTVNDSEKTMSSDILCKDPKYSKNILLKRLQAKKSMTVTPKRITPIIDVQCLVKKIRVEATKCLSVPELQETSIATESQLPCVEVQEDVPMVEKEICDKTSVVEQIKTYNVEESKNDGTSKSPKTELTGNCTNDDSIKESRDDIDNEIEKDNINSCEIISRSDYKITLSEEKQETELINTFHVNENNENDDGNIEDVDNGDDNKDDDDKDIKDVNDSSNNIRDSNCDNDNDENVEKDYMPISILNKYMKEKTVNSINKSKRRNKKLTRNICTVTDMFVKNQLQRLIDNDWVDDIHCDVLDKLNILCGPRIIAKCVIEFLLDCSNDKHDLDKSFTPPAPAMLKFEQKVTVLLIDLEQLKPTVVSFVQAGIQHKLFNLISRYNVSEVETLSRIFVTLACIQSNREKIRIMCCDALYCLGVRAINVLYIALTCWPEILPNANVDKGLLPKCIAFLIIIQKADNYKKLFALKSLITSYYQYDKEMNNKDITEELMAAFENKQQDNLEAAIILFAKRNGTSWTYDNIIKPIILPTIIHQKYPCMFSAFSLLGKLLRTFPLKSKDNTVRNICEQLSDILKSGKVSDDEEEGITSALLSLSRHEFNLVVTSVMKWTPRKPLRPSTIAQLKTFVKLRNTKIWQFFKKQEELLN